MGIAQAQPEVVGARLTGAGFGGSIVALARRDGAAAARRIAGEYTRRSGRRGTVILPA